MSIGASYYKTYLPPCLETHKPLDPVIILPDTKDLKLTGFAERFEGAEAKSRKFSEHYRRVVESCSTGVGKRTQQAVLLPPGMLLALRQEQAFHQPIAEFLSSVQ